MKLLKIVSFYKDSQGREWEVWKDSLPKKKGEYKWWNAHCRAHNIEFRSSLKREILRDIKNLSQFKS